MGPDNWGTIGDSNGCDLAGGNKLIAPLNGSNDQSYSYGKIDLLLLYKHV